MRSIILASAVALLCAGCGHFEPQGGGGRYDLPSAEARLAQSLAHYMQGLLLESEPGMSGSATAAFAKAARLDPATAMLGDLHITRLLQEERIDEALAELKERCAAQPVLENHAGLAAVAEASGDYQLALRHYRAAARLASDKREWQLAEARLLYKLQRDRAAVALLGRLCRGGAAGDDPELPFGWAHNFITREKQPQRGIRLLTLALTCASNATQRAQIYDLEVLAQVQLDNTNGARYASRAAAAELPLNLMLAANVARIEHALWGSDVTNRWQREIATNPAAITDCLTLAQQASGERQWQRAADALAQAKARGAARGLPPPPLFYSMLGNAQEQAEQAESAEATLKEGLRLYPRNALLSNHLAYYWSQRAVKLDEAEELAKLALSVEPHNGAYLDTLGWVYYQQARYREALEKLTQAIALENDDPTILDHLGDTLLQLERRQEALTCWRLSLRADPHCEAVAEKIKRYSE